MLPFKDDGDRNNSEILPEMGLSLLEKIDDRWIGRHCGIDFGPDQEGSDRSSGTPIFPNCLSRTIFFAILTKALK
jgi:hypothetical protein